MTIRKHLPTGLQLLECLGFKFHFDLDQNLEIAIDRQPTHESILAWLKEHYAEDIKQQLRWRISLDRQQLIGGPCNGKRWSPNFCSHAHAEHVRHGLWAAYYCPDFTDGRAFFCGTAPNKKQAKSLAWSRHMYFQKKKAK